MLEDLNREVFEPLLHSAFKVTDEEKNSVAMELIEVASDSKDPRFEHLSLLFRGPAQPLLPQKIYVFEHSRIGAFQLFIVPIGQDAEGTLYEAVFNRMKNAQEIDRPCQ